MHPWAIVCLVAVYGCIGAVIYAFVLYACERTESPNAEWFRESVAAFFLAVVLWPFLVLMLLVTGVQLVAVRVVSRKGA